MGKVFCSFYNEPWRFFNSVERIMCGAFRVLEILGRLAGELDS